MALRAALPRKMHTDGCRAELLLLPILMPIASRVFGGGLSGMGIGARGDRGDRELQGNNRGIFSSLKALRAMDRVGERAVGLSPSHDVGGREGEVGRHITSCLPMPL